MQRTFRTFFIIFEKKNAFFYVLFNIILPSVIANVMFLICSFSQIDIGLNYKLLFPFATCFFPLTYEILYYMSGWLYWNLGRLMI